MAANPKKCLLCKSGDRRVVFAYRSPDKYERAAGVARTDYFRKWVQCRQCGFYYSIYSRSPKILDRLYASAYRDERASWRHESAEATFRKIVALPKGKSETKFRVGWIKENIADLWRQGIVERSAPPYKFLDVGGGAGIFAYEFQRKNWQAYIADPSQGNEFIENELGIPIRRAFYRPGLFNFKFTLISVNYVLEHLCDPRAFLKSVSRDLAKNSLLYIEVPDALCFRRLPRDHDIFNACHLWMFDPKSLTAFLNYCGFEVLALSRIKALRGHYGLMALSSQNRH